MSEPRTNAVDVAVLGGGPAGATAALQLAREGLSVCLVDPLGIGGALINVDRLPDYPGFPGGVAGWDLAAALGEHALSAGVAVTMSRAASPVHHDGGWMVPLVDADVALEAGAVLIATGSRPRPLPGDDGTMEGSGLSYCAACDGPVFAGRPVVVVGDGLIALAEAVSLAPLVETVTIVFGAETPSAGTAWVDAVNAFDNIQWLGGQTVTDVRVDGQGRVIGVDASSASGESRTIEAAAVFGALEPLPNSEPFASLTGVGPDGRIPVDHTYAVVGAAPGLFAAGDVRIGAALRAITAAGDGAGAAIAIAAFLRR